MALTILKVRRAEKNVYAVLDGPVALNDHGKYRVGQWAELRVKQGGHFPVAEFLRWNTGIEPESLEGYEVEKV